MVNSFSLRVASFAQGAKKCFFGAKVLGFCTRFFCWVLRNQGFAEVVGCKSRWVLRGSKVEGVQKCGEARSSFSPNRAREEAFLRSFAQTDASLRARFGISMTSVERFLTGAVRFSLEPLWLVMPFCTYLLYTIWDLFSLTIFGHLGKKCVDTPFG